MVGVHADLRRQVECDGKSSCAMREKILVALVRFLSIAHTRVLAHGPEPATVHGGLHASGKRELARITRVAVIIPAFKIGRGIERLWVDFSQFADVSRGPRTRAPGLRRFLRNLGWRTALVLRGLGWDISFDFEMVGHGSYFFLFAMRLAFTNECTVK